jgi:hypothetical protein
MPDTITSNALMTLSSALCDFSDKLDDYIKDAPDPFSAEMVQLRSFDTRIAMDAKIIAGIAAELAAPGVRDAITDLTTQVDNAKSTLRQVNDTKVALSLVASVLSVAAAISTGNPLGAACPVLGLVNAVQGTIQAARA